MQELLITVIAPIVLTSYHSQSSIYPYINVYLSTVLLLNPYLCFTPSVPSCNPQLIYSAFSCHGLLLTLPKHLSAPPYVYPSVPQSIHHLLTSPKQLGLQYPVLSISCVYGGTIWCLSVFWPICMTPASY